MTLATPRISIVLAEDHRLIREGVRALLALEPDFGILGETGDGLEAVRLAGQLRPDVLLLDLMLPGLNGLEVLRRVRQSAPGTRVIMLTLHADETYAFEAFKNGAVGYVLKDATARDLADAIRTGMAGGRYASAPLSWPAIEARLQDGAQASCRQGYEELTDREREVLQLVAEGNSSVQIGLRLDISPRTAEVHRARLMRKLGVRKQTDLVRYALSRGLLPSVGSPLSSGAVPPGKLPLLEPPASGPAGAEAVSARL